MDSHTILIWDIYKNLGEGKVLNKDLKFSNISNFHQLLELFISATCGKENGDCVHGYCSSPGVCTCHPGYTGDKCEICETHPGCVYGYCDDAPFQCKCFDGYTGYFCDEPICSEGCHPDRVKAILYFLK